MDIFLYREFCNHAYLGQWELARACAFALAENVSFDNPFWTKLKLTLKELSRKPSLVKTSWPAFPSPSFVAFLSLKLMQQICYDEDFHDVPEITDLAEFNIMVEEVLLKYSKSQILELSHTSFISTQRCRNTNKLEGGVLSSDVVSAIKDLLLKDSNVIPLLLHKLCKSEENSDSYLLKRKICDIYISCLSHCLSYEELSSVAHDSKKVREFSVELCHFLSLMPDFILTASECSDLREHWDEVLLNVLNLCASGSLCFQKVYSPLISKSSPYHLKYFCSKEDEYFGFRNSHCIGSYIETCKRKTSLNSREVLLWSAKTNKHFLESILEYNVRKVASGNFDDNVNLLSQPLFNRLKPLVFILSWNCCTDDASFSNVATTMKHWHSSSSDETSLVETCGKFLTNISFKERCISYYNKLFPHAGSGELASKACSIFNMVQCHSPLSVLQEAFGLKNINPELVFNLLDISMTGQEQDGITTLISSRDTMIYRGYLLISLIMEAILYSSSISQALEKSNLNVRDVLYESETHVKLDDERTTELTGNLFDHISYDAIALNDFISVNGFQAAYSKFVVQRLERCKQEIKSLYPLTFRTEVLEDLFSLLFVSSEDIHDVSSHSDSDEGHEDEEKQSSRSGKQRTNTFVKFADDKIWNQTLFKSNVADGRFSSTDYSEKKNVGRFFIRRIKSKEILDGRSEYGDVHSSHGSSRSTGSTGSSGVSVNGFLCCGLFIRDFLPLLKDAIVGVTAELFKARKKEDLMPGITQPYRVKEDEEPKNEPVSSILEYVIKHRLVRLQRYVNEASWRFEIVQSDTFRSFYCCKRRPFQNSDENKTVKTGERWKLMNEMSSMTYSGTDNGSDSGNRKRAKKKKRKRTSKSSCIFHGRLSHANVIQHMLSKPHALIRYCLWKKNYKKASEALEWYQMQSSLEAAEFKFSGGIGKLCNKVKTATDINEKVYNASDRKNTSNATNMMVIAKAAASGLQSSTAISVIEQEISQMKIPEIPEVTAVMKSLAPSEKKLFCGAENAPCLVLADLSFTRSLSMRSSLVLLELAIGWCREIHVSMPITKKHENFTRGCFETLQLVFMLINCFQSFSANEFSQSKMRHIFFPLFPKYSSFSECLVSYLGPIESLSFVKCLEVWKNVLGQTKEFRCLLFQTETEVRNSTSAESEDDLSNFAVRSSLLHSSYIKLEKAVLDVRGCSADCVRPRPTKYRNYLKKLFVYLEQVANALMCYKDQTIFAGASPYTSYFSVMAESPPEILQKIVLQKQIPPKKIEKFALGMKVDLAQVLLDSFFSKVPLHRDFSADFCCSSVASKTQVSLEQPSIILNYSSEAVHPPRHPDVVARELLKKFMSIVQDVLIAKVMVCEEYPDILLPQGLVSLLKHSELSAWMNECSELAYVDLELLKSSEEQFAFFINVTNIAWMHALLMAADQKFHRLYSEGERELCLSPVVSSSLFERIIWQKLCGYCVGQLGAISLFDLRYYILHSNFSFPNNLDVPPYNVLLRNPSSVNSLWTKYAQPAQSKLLFVLCEGFLYSPKLQVMHSEIISNQLDEAVKDYVNFSVQVDVDKRCVILPQLLEWYCLDFDSQQGMSSRPYEGLIDWVSSFTDSELSESLKCLLSLESEASIHKSNSSLDQEQQIEVLFQPASLVPGLQLSYSHVNEISVSLRERKELDSTIVFPEFSVLMYIHEKCPVISKLFSLVDPEDFDDCLWPSVSYTPTNYHPITRLLKRNKTWASHASNANPEEIHPSSWLHSALSPTPSRLYTLRKVEDGMKNCAWIYSLYYLDSFMEFQKWSDPCFTIARQIILEYLSDSEFMCDERFPDPYCWALCITDPSGKAQNVLRNVQKWSEEPSIKALRFCLSETTIKKDVKLFTTLNNRLKEVELYEKILKVINEGNILNENSTNLFSGWQDIAEYSTWDQHIVLNYLKDCGQYELVCKWAKFNPIDSSAKMMVSAMQIIWFLGQNPPLVSEANEIFDSFEPADYMELSSIVLPELSSVESKLHFVEFMLKTNLEYEDKMYFSNMIIGLKMLRAVRLNARDYYDSVVEHPKLLLEQLLMNMEIKVIEEALEAVSEDLKSDVYIQIELSPLAINQLLETYASKALELPIVDEIFDSTVSNATILNSDEVIKAVDASEEPFVMPNHVPSKSEWVEDSKVHTCQVCKDEQFNMFSRRHHCRRCGRVVCSNCSQRRLVVEGYGKFPVRVCDDCYSQTVCDRMPGSRSPSLRSLSIDKRYHMLSSMKVTSRSSPNPPASETYETRQRAVSIDSKELFYWTLTGNNEQDESIRNEFFFDPAPSVSLCLSILKMHSNPQQCARFMLTLCDKLIEKIQPKHFRLGNNQVDYFLMISMIRSFLVNAEIKYRQLQDHEGEALVDGYMQHLDVIKILINANCAHLIPRGDLWNNETMRKLRDRLIAEERMSLALDLNTNFGLDKNSVWAPWGLSCLRAGDFLAAREKFKQCLKVPSNPSSSKQESSLLSTVISALENSKYSVSEEDSAVTQSLSSLEQVKRGVFEVPSRCNKIPDRIKEECLFYLTTYGSHFSVISFYRRQNLINEALNYVLNQKCSADVFIEALFLPFLKCGQLSTLQDSLTSNDLTLSKWWNYLLATCRYLERNSYQKVLYQMQLFMEDYVRAAKCSINFYISSASSYETLFKRYHHLHNAKKHFESYKRSCSESSNYLQHIRHVMTIPTKEVDQYLRIIKLQEDVSHYFELCKAEGLPVPFVENYSDTDSSSCPPTLFEGKKRKTELMKMVLVNAVKVDEGFDLAAKVIKECMLDPTSTACDAGEELINSHENEQIPHFLHSLKCNFNQAIDTDTVTLTCISACTKQGIDADSLIKQLDSDANKVNAYLICGKLKSAYLLAVKLNRSEDILRILSAAKQKGQEGITQQCEKWLRANITKLNFAK